MKKILSLLSFLMLAVVAMAADLTTGVTFKGTWADVSNDYAPVEGTMTVTKVDNGLKFEVKGILFNSFSIPDYTIVFPCGLAEDGTITGTKSDDYAEGEAKGNAPEGGMPFITVYWEGLSGSVTSEAIDIKIVNLGSITGELNGVTFKGKVEAINPEPDPDPNPGETGEKTKEYTDNFVWTYLANGELVKSAPEECKAKFTEKDDHTFKFEIEAQGMTIDGIHEKYDPTTGDTHYEGTYFIDDKNNNIQYNFTVLINTYTKEEKECIYMIAKSDNANELTYIFGTDPNAAPEPDPEPDPEPTYKSYVEPAMYSYGWDDEEDPPYKKFVEAQEIQLTDNGDGTYTVVIMKTVDADGDPTGDLKFNAKATTNNDQSVTLTADEKEVPFGGYYSWHKGQVKFDGTLKDEKLEAKFFIEFPAYPANVEFGKNVTNAIKNVNADNTAVESIYTVGGARVNSLQKGINIVRLANGKTIKVIK